MKHKAHDIQQQRELSSDEGVSNDTNSNGENADGVTLDEPVEDGDAMLNLLSDEESEDGEEETTT